MSDWCLQSKPLLQYLQYGCFAVAGWADAGLLPLTLSWVDTVVAAVETTAAISAEFFYLLRWLYTHMLAQALIAGSLIKSQRIRYEGHFCCPVRAKRRSEQPKSEYVHVKMAITRPRRSFLLPSARKTAFKAVKL